MNYPRLIAVILLLLFVVASIGSLVYFFEMDGYYHITFFITKEKGNQTINNLVAATAKYENNSQRLNQIANLITDDFTDMFWESEKNDQYFCHYLENGKDVWAWCPPLYGILGSDPHNYAYTLDKRGRVRVMVNNDLAFDPYWVAYQKTGACQAISIFFNETANRSGFVSRVVRSDGAYGNGGHMWDEVLIGGEWKYFDVQKYGEVKYRKYNFSNDDSPVWFGNRSDFGINTGAGLCDTTERGVYVLNLTNYGYGENITSFYDQLNECPHGLHL